MRHPRLPLDHPNRELLHSLVGDQPGIHVRRLVAESRLGVGNTRHHLDVLVAAGVVVLRRSGRRIHCFLADDFSESSWRMLAARADPHCERLAWLVGVLGAPSQGALIQDANRRWAWSRTGTQDRLRRLVEDGVLVGPGRRGGAYRLA